MLRPPPRQAQTLQWLQFNLASADLHSSEQPAAICWHPQLPGLEPQRSQTAWHPDTSRVRVLLLVFSSSRFNQGFPESHLQKINESWEIMCRVFTAHEFLGPFPFSGVEPNLKKQLASAYCKMKSGQAEMASLCSQQLRGGRRRCQNLWLVPTWVQFLIRETNNKFIYVRVPSNQQINKNQEALTLPPANTEWGPREKNLVLQHDTQSIICLFPGNLCWNPSGC